jgi:hypothetical protein
MADVRGAAAEARRKLLERGPSGTPGGEAPPPPEKGSWPARPKVVGRKAKRTRVSTAEAADCLERR